MPRSVDSPATSTVDDEQRDPRDGCSYRRLDVPALAGLDGQRRVLRLVAVRGAAVHERATSSSWAARTRPGRPPCTSPATRRASRSVCRSAIVDRACRSTSSTEIRGQGEHPRCASATQVVDAAGDGRLETLTLRGPDGAEDRAGGRASSSSSAPRRAPTGYPTEIAATTAASSSIGTGLRHERPGRVRDRRRPLGISVKAAVASAVGEGPS